MAFKVHNPFFDRRDDELQIDATLFKDVMVEQSAPILPAEWYPQSGVQLTWPHKDTDWAPMLKEVQACFKAVAREIAKRELLLIVTPEPDAVRAQIEDEVNMEHVRFFKCDTNDTWARDHGAITLTDSVKPHLLDFCFNGWGDKFPAALDNAINKRLFDSGVFNGAYENHLDFVLEGGSIESDGRGTVFTTAQCLLAPHRNQPLHRSEIDEQLCQRLGARRVVWLDHGNLIGDDTDGHIDTIVRCAPDDTLIYIRCNDEKDAHYEDFLRLEQQLETLRTTDGLPYRLLPLPFPDAICEDGERLPATYANFLIVNGAVICPTYAQPENDRAALETLQLAFPTHEIIGIDARTIIRQHGSIHCLTMQFPEGAIHTNP